ncbi:hypothetical protein TRFO_01176 [Tritrichomonas foetus]|nr:hypothetical protein TRFO_01176 [Tritrichomonas foetus]|eukprot:OHT11223.1 hypothetical protein TRFO_01176 [Tritrichomonas foetus]
MRKQITETTKTYFQRQEELLLIDYYKQSEEQSRKVRELRMQLAEGFLYHLGRAVRSYDNQIVAQTFCLSFRVLSEPLVNNAVSYFYEKRHLKTLVNSAIKQRKTLKSIVQCAKLYHFGYSWGQWRKFIQKANSMRTNGLMETIRRRTEVLQLYPYFNWVEILPVRPPRPLKDVETMFKDLPLVSIQRKVARERVHHVNVRMMLLRRRTLRDFLRAFASYTQEQIAIREVMKLCRKRASLRLITRAFTGFKIIWLKDMNINPRCESLEDEINSNISAWYRHFFRARVHQKKIVEKIPLT